MYPSDSFIRKYIKSIYYKI